MIQLIPIKSRIQVPETIFYFKEHIYLNRCMPVKIIADPDPIFIRRFWKAIFESLVTKLAWSSDYQPQTNGQIQIGNR